MKTETEQSTIHEQTWRLVTALLTPELVRRLDAEARRRTMSRSLLIREACEAYLQRPSAREGG